MEATIEKRSQRQREIIARMRSGRTLSVLALASDLAVSDETIRRELRALEEQGVIIREHGGARLATQVHEGRSTSAWRRMPTPSCASPARPPS
jgi:DeoR family glycerol-3-phosphate regulon repressor